MNERTHDNKQKLLALRDHLQNRSRSLIDVNPNKSNPGAMIKLCLAAAQRNISLLQCSPESVMTALMDSFSLGLQPFTPLNLAWIIPYTNRKTGVKEAKFLPSASGFCDLAMRSGMVKLIDSEVVYEKDTFECEKGLNPKLSHIPNYTCGNRGKPILAYALIKFKDDSFKYEVMSIEQIEEVRAKSQTPNQGPWVDWWDQMARKSVLKRLLKTCKISPEIEKAVDHDNSPDNGGITIDMEADILDKELEELSTSDAKLKTKADNLVEKLVGIQ